MLHACLVYSHWSVCESYSGAIFTFLSVTPVRDLPKYATLVVDKIAKSGAMQIYDILPVHLRGVARVHIWSSLPPKKFFVALDEGITSVAEIPPTNSISSEGYREKTKLAILSRTDHSSHRS